MDEALKQKIVGALVVATALIIFVPTIFDEPMLDESLLKVDVPSQPGDLNVADFDVIERTEDFERAKTQIQALRDTKGEVIDADMPPHTGDNEGKIREVVTQLVDNIKDVTGGDSKQEVPAPIPAWTIQLASFIDRENAVKLQRRLREGNEKAYIQKWASPGGQVYRVYAGPMLKLEDAKSALKRLDKAYDMQGMVIRYNPQ